MEQKILMTSKQLGDIGEQKVIIRLMEMGLPVLKPLGDRLPYDLAIDTGAGRMVRIQVKVAWWNESSKSYMADTRQSQTNRKVYRRTKYTDKDYDFFVVWLRDTDIFYVFPAIVTSTFASSIHFVEEEKRQRQPRSWDYRERWDLLT